MMKKQKMIENRPNYFYGQLLLEEDFLAEQNYHINARRRYNLECHGSGIVSGLQVDRLNETSLTVRSGLAIDQSGQEVFLDSAEVLDLSGEFGANDVVSVSLSYLDGAKESGAADTSSVSIYTVITASKTKEESGGVLLASVRLDGQGKIGPDSIDYSRTRYAGKLLTPGAVGAIDLAPELKTGWIRMPFHPIGLVNIPEGETELPPSFRVGPTEALSPKPEKTDGKDLGAAGTMPIPLPASVKKIIRFRIAGSRNEEKITVRLLLGGWDSKKMEHVTQILIDETFSGVPFLKTYDIKAEDCSIDPEYSTLSLWLRCTKRAAISLVAVEVGY